MNETPNPAFPPPEERLADRLASSPTPRRSALATALREVADVDRAVYRAIARTATPTLDEPLRRLSGLANYSTLWLAIAAGLFVAGGKTGRRAAMVGIAAIGVNSAAVNLPMKFASGRGAAGSGIGRRPVGALDGDADVHLAPVGSLGVGIRVRGAVAGELPALAVPLRALATAVAYSRVHTGVHYPGDVVVGSLIGATIGEAVSLSAHVARRRRTQHAWIYSVGRCRGRRSFVRSLRTRLTACSC